jgi:hypothetical protein
MVLMDTKDETYAWEQVQKLTAILLERVDRWQQRALRAESVCELVFSELGSDPKDWTDGDWAAEAWKGNK